MGGDWVSDPLSLPILLALLARLRQTTIISSPTHSIVDGASNSRQNRPHGRYPLGAERLGRYDTTIVLPQPGAWAETMPAAAAAAVAAIGCWRLAPLVPGRLRASLDVGSHVGTVESSPFKVLVLRTCERFRGVEARAVDRRGKT